MEATHAKIARSTPDRLRGAVTALVRQRFFTVLVMLVALLVFFSLTEERYMTSANIEAMLSSASILWIVAIGSTFVMLTGGFDLSVGSLLALCGILLGLCINDWGIAPWSAILIVLAFGALVGTFVNGYLIGRLGLPFFVITLATLILYRGLVNLTSDTKTTAINSSLLDSIAYDKWLGLAIPVWIMLATIVIAAYVLRSTYFGRDVYAVGGNPTAAALSGVKVSRTLMAVYGIVGLAAALGGVLQSARIGAASPQVGQDIIFDAAAAVLLGGTLFSGGVGGVAGTAVGVLFLAALQNGLSVTGVQTFWQQIFTGLILILAMLLYKAQRDGLGVRDLVSRIVSRRGVAEPAADPASAP
jgi:ribose/xylose/arabinose/galactoside ABC-type transport system permease subunit